MQLVNLTPHSITLRDSTGADHAYPSAGVARVASTPGVLETIPGVPVPVAGPTIYGSVEGLPDPVDGAGVLYVVSALVLGHPAVRGRADVVAPGTGPRDGAVRYPEDHPKHAGQIMAVTRLVRA